MVEWVVHDTIFRDIMIVGEIVNKEPIRIGRGKTLDPTALTDLKVLTIIRNGKVEPYIPGSSLKGVFRSTAESIARIHTIPVCEISPTKICGGLRKKDLERAMKENNRGKLIEIVNSFCIICKIFGSASYKSHVDFYDAYVQGPFKLSVKTGIAINRRTGAVVPRALYNVEYVEPGARFGFMLTATNLPNYALGLISHVIDYINAGIVKIGGFKSRGFGAVNININKIVINGPMGIVNGKLVALDENDTEIGLNVSGTISSPQQIRDFLNAVKKAWENYVAKVKSGGGK